ncbi:MAG: hypothetical protein CO108_18435 [Deltaproteobacteria bacterium CG_4_9_14_3_um_filter_63_12]|nr:MAG: hypothetical protein CO108_18435 [Deltaproteobacteria bacterium CG_4_9_14_3_um_filter_63_12]
MGLGLSRSESGVGADCGWSVNELSMENLVVSSFIGPIASVCSQDHLVQRALAQRRLEDENRQLRETIDELCHFDTIVGESPAILKVVDLVRTLAPTDATVMIRGESGTGKELIARAVHANSRRRYAPIVPVACGAFPETLLESELFGHERGAFESGLRSSTQSRRWSLRISF